MGLLIQCSIALPPPSPLFHPLMHSPIHSHASCWLRQAGNLYEGDEILSVNGIDFTKATYVQATEIIRANCKAALELVVRSNPDVYAKYKKKMAKLQKRFVDDRKQRVGVSTF